jgi:PKD repeat protein
MTAHPTRLVVSGSTGGGRAPSVMAKADDDTPRLRLWRDTVAVLMLAAVAIFLVVTVAPLFLGGQQQAVLEATGTPTASQDNSTVTLTSPSAAASATLVPSPASSPSRQPTPTIAAPSATPARTATPTATPARTATPAPTLTPRPTPTRTPSPSPTPAPPHIVTFNAAPTSGEAPLSVVFSGTFTNGDGWTLDFGDGQAKNSTAASVAAAHTYLEAGPYQATLTVRRGSTTDKQSITITVTATPSPSPSPS